MGGWVSSSLGPHPWHCSTALHRLQPQLQPLHIPPCSSHGPAVSDGRVPGPGEVHVPCRGSDGFPRCVCVPWPRCHGRAAPASTAASPGTEGLPCMERDLGAHSSPSAAGRWEVRGLCRRLGMAAGCWSPARHCLEAAVVFPDTDPREGTQSCSQCLHRRQCLCMEGQTAHGEGAHWIRVSCVWHPKRMTMPKSVASGADGIP